MRPTIKKKLVARIQALPVAERKRQLFSEIESIKALPAPVSGVNGRKLYVRPVSATPVMREEVIPASVVVNGRSILASALIPKPLGVESHICARSSCAWSCPRRENRSLPV